MKLRRWTFLEVCVVASIVGVLVMLLLPTGDYDHRHRYPPTIRTTESDAAIAGEFYQGAARGRYFSLSILADGRYSFVWSGCTGVHHRESGHVEKAGDDLVLTPTTPAVHRIDHRLRLVRWQDRRYLIPPHKMADLIEEIVRGEEPRYRHAGHFYVDDPAMSVEGLPELPPDAMSELHRRVSLGKITGRDESGAWTIDLGTDQGLRPGDMLLARGTSRSRPRSLKIVTADRSSCKALVTLGDSDGEPLAPGHEIPGERFAPSSEPR